MTSQTAMQITSIADVKPWVVPISPTQNKCIVNFRAQVNGEWITDEGENVGTVTEALIRGVAENAASGCQCAVEPGVPTRSGGSLGLVLGMALAGGFAARRRARHSRARAVATAARALAALGFIAAVGMAPGCSCSSEDTVKATGCRARGTG